MKNFFQLGKREGPVLEVMLVLVLSFAFFGYIQFSTPNLVGTDGFFNIKYAYILRTEGFSRDFPWWQYSIYSDHFADPYFLFHILLIPFTFLDLIFAAKLSAVFFGAVMVSVFYFVLKKLSVKYPLIWTLVFVLASSKLIYRINYPRVIPLSIAFLVLISYFVVKKNYIGLFVASFLYVWAYPPFYFILLIIGANVIAQAFSKKKIDAKAIIFGFGGVFSGFIINPYFPNNLVISWIAGFDIIKNILTVTELPIPTEWKTPELLSVFKNSFIIFPLFIFSIFSFFKTKIKKKEEFITLFLISLVFLIGSFKVVRTIEYAVPFVMLFSAITISRYLKEKHFSKRNKLIIIILIILIIAPICARNFSVAHDNITKARDSDRFKHCALWLQQNTPPGSVVFHSSWDNFPELFFYNHNNYYLYGLAANPLYAYDSDLYREWDSIRKGKLDNPSKSIKTVFNSNYIFVDKRYGKFMAKLESDPDIKRTFISPSCRVYVTK